MSNTPIEDILRSKISDGLKPTLLEVYNDSYKHRHHQAMRGATNTVESHFRLVIVSDAFEGKNQPARHRMVYHLCQEEMSKENGVHALQLETKTPKEWEKKSL
ncbi:bolA-like protein 1 [Trichomonascus vanleenenianus]|uniref:Bol1p n=1 Tax=Trichomonascus vanleenenianus TaxID=2268995 RepID=UPI003ECA5404